MNTQKETIHNNCAPNISECLKAGYHTVMKNKKFAFVSILILMVVNILGNSSLYNINSMLIQFLIELLFGVVLIYLLFGIVKGGLNIIDGKKTELEILTKTTTQNLIGYILVSLLSSLIVFAGALLLIIPGIYFALRFFFAETIFVDKGYPLWKNFQESTKLTHGIKWQLLGLAVVLLIINILGFLALGVGLILTVPVSLFTVLHFYRALQKKH